MYLYLKISFFFLFFFKSKIIQITFEFDKTDLSLLLLIPPKYPTNNLTLLLSNIKLHLGSTSLPRLLVSPSPRNDFIDSFRLEAGQNSRGRWKGRGTQLIPVH